MKIIIVVLAVASLTSQVFAASKRKPAFQYESEGIAVPAASADEPRMPTFGWDSVIAARRYLDNGALAWVREKSCVACHSTGVYLAERPALSALLGPPQREVLEDFINSVPEQPPQPRMRDGVKYFNASIQSVWRSLGLANWDRHIEGRLSPHTDRSLRHTLQCLADEGFIKTFPQVEIPYITTDYQLTAQAARAMLTAPGWLETVKDEETRERIARMKRWLRTHEPISDFERALQLELALIAPDLVPAGRRESAVGMLWRRQQPDGGWSTRRMSDLMKWHEKMDPKVVRLIQSEPDADAPASDAYMTAWAIVLLRESGVPADDVRIRNAVRWLKENQRISGRWWMKSLFRGNYHYTTYISTAVALRALALCGEIPDLSASE